MHNVIPQRKTTLAKWGDAALQPELALRRTPQDGATARRALQLINCDRLLCSVRAKQHGANSPSTERLRPVRFTPGGLFFGTCTAPPRSDA